MDINVFFTRIDRAYRFMLARDAFCGFMLYAGAGVAAAAVAAYLLQWGPVPAAVLSGIAAAAGLVYAGRRMRNCRSYEAALYCDRALEGHDRFPALQELLASGRETWARRVLAAECSVLIAERAPVQFPLCRGRGRYCLLPFLIVILCLGLPFPGPQADLPDPPAPVSPQVKGLMPLIPSETALSAAGDFSQAEIRALMQQDAFRRLIRELLAAQQDREALQAGVDRVAALIREGDTGGLRALIDLIEEAAGGGGKGSGAGLTDALRAVMDQNDTERIAAEFRLFMEQLAAREDRLEIILTMRGPIEKYEQGLGTGWARPETGPDPGGIRTVPVQAWEKLPVRYRATLQNYFAPTE